MRMRIGMGRGRLKLAEKAIAIVVAAKYEPMNQPGYRKDPVSFSY
jgi:hypothetical protein